MLNSDIVRIENLEHRRDIFYLEWRVTSLCNYQCDFCIQGSRETHLKLAAGESEKVRQMICDKLVLFLEKLAGYRAVEIRLIGGEVTILKDFPLILEKLARVPFRGDISILITTNFSRSAQYYRRLFDIVRVCDKKNARRSLRISASFYSAYTTWEVVERKLREVKRHLRLQRFPDYAAAFFKHGIALKRYLPVQTSFLAVGIPILSNDDYYQYKERKKALQGSGISIFAIFIRQYHTNVRKDIMETLLKENLKRRLRVIDNRGESRLMENMQALGVELEDMNRFCPKGYWCDAGIHSIWVSATGEIYRCPAIGSNMKMGDLLTDSWNILKEKTVCTSDHCSCNMFGVIEKINSMD